MKEPSILLTNNQSERKLISRKKQRFSSFLDMSRYLIIYDRQCLSNSSKHLGQKK